MIKYLTNEKGQGIAFILFFIVLMFVIVNSLGGIFNLAMKDYQKDRIEDGLQAGSNGAVKAIEKTSGNFANISEGYYGVEINHNVRLNPETAIRNFEYLLVRNSGDTLDEVMPFISVRAVINPLGGGGYEAFIYDENGVQDSDTTYASSLELQNKINSYLSNGRTVDLTGSRDVINNMSERPYFLVAIEDYPLIRGFSTEPYTAILLEGANLERRRDR